MKPVTSTNAVLGFWASLWQVLRGARILVHSKPFHNNQNQGEIHCMPKASISTLAYQTSPQFQAHGLRLRELFEEIEARAEKLESEGKSE